MQHIAAGCSGLQGTVHSQYRHCSVRAATTPRQGTLSFDGLAWPSCDRALLGQRVPPNRASLPTDTDRPATPAEAFSVNSSFYEFFAGGGMARAGLGDGWRCLFANDFDRKKAATYRLNWPGDQMFAEDVRKVSTEQLPESAELAWASFPCQDLSLAGGGAGLKGERSGTFWPFWRLMSALADEGRAPTIIALENVCGTITSHGGDDFKALCQAMSAVGYHYGALVVDAALFVPQSRPRLILVAVREGAHVPGRLSTHAPSAPFHPAALRSAVDQLPDELKQGWIWWSLSAPPPRNLGLEVVPLFWTGR